MEHSNHTSNPRTEGTCAVPLISTVTITAVSTITSTFTSLGTMHHFHFTMATPSEIGSTGVVNSGSNASNGFSWSSTNSSLPAPSITQRYQKAFAAVLAPWWGVSWASLPGTAITIFLGFLSFRMIGKGNFRRALEWASIHEAYQNMLLVHHYLAIVVISTYLSGVGLPLTDSRPSAVLLLICVEVWTFSLVVSGPAIDSRRRRLRMQPPNDAAPANAAPENAAPADPDQAAAAQAIEDQANDQANDVSVSKWTGFVQCLLVLVAVMGAADWFWS
jgi:hypothetical protein